MELITSLDVPPSLAGAAPSSAPPVRIGVVQHQAVLVADLAIDQREDWLTLFPFLRTRRPDTYAGLA